MQLNNFDNFVSWAKICRLISLYFTGSNIFLLLGGDSFCFSAIGEWSDNKRGSLKYIIKSSITILSKKKKSSITNSYV
jgi:hypothetical protein